ncbi:MAG: hypothetical protein ABH884_00775 [Candidatus Komeilibacteria bacterium]
MDPDQDPRLTILGPSQETCDKCMMELYPDVDDSICDNCGLNSMNNGQSIKEFISEAAEHESQFSEIELRDRQKKMNVGQV